MKERNRRMMLARLDHHVVPLLGRKKLSEVPVRDVEQFIRDARDRVTAKNEKTGPRTRIIVRGGPGAAAKVVRDVSAVFTFAVRHELVAARSTSICAHMQQDPARRAADRVIGPIATALGTQDPAEVIDLTARKSVG